jgi:hypothetical protein
MMRDQAAQTAKLPLKLCSSATNSAPRVANIGRMPVERTVAPHPDIEIRVYSNFRRDLLLFIGLIVALIYWRKKRPARSATHPH